MPDILSISAISVLFNTAETWSTSFPLLTSRRFLRVTPSALCPPSPAGIPASGILTVARTVSLAGISGESRAPKAEAGGVNKLLAYLAAPCMCKGALGIMPK